MHPTGYEVAACSDPACNPGFSTIAKPENWNRRALNRGPRETEIKYLVQKVWQKLNDADDMLQRFRNGDCDEQYLIEFILRVALSKEPKP
jgi:hypothetical protein